LGDIEMMSAPVRHHASGILAVVPPIREIPVYPARTENRAVRTLRRRPQPTIPIKARFHRFLGKIAPPARAADCCVDVHGLDLADAAAANQLTGQPELRARPLLTAGLKDAVILADRIDHGLGFVDG